MARPVPLSREEFAAWMAQGLSPEQLGRMNPDSLRAVQQQPQQGGETDPLGMVTGMGSAAVDAIGGPKALGIGAGAVLTAGGAYLGGKKWLDRKKPPGGPPSPGSRPPAGPPAPNGPESRISEARAAKMEADARAAAARADLAERKLAPAPAKAAPSRTTTPKAPKPKRTTKPPEPIPIRTDPAETQRPMSSRSAELQQERAERLGRPPTNPDVERADKLRSSVADEIDMVLREPPAGTKPIKVQGKPKAVRGTKQRGVSKREIASRQAGMAASRAPAPLPETDDIMEQLARSLHVEQGMTARGVPRTGGLRGAVRSGLRGATHPAVSLLLMLMDAGAIPGQMDEAEEFGEEQFMPKALIEQMKRQPRPGSL